MVLSTKFQDIEFSAGRLGIEEEAFLSKQRRKAFPDDFPASPPLISKSGPCDKLTTVELVGSDEANFIGASLLDDNELDMILQGGDLEAQSAFGLECLGEAICDIEMDK